MIKFSSSQEALFGPLDPKSSESPLPAQHQTPPPVRMFPLVVAEAEPTEAVLASAANGKMQFQTGAGKGITVAVEKLVRWGWPQPIQQQPVLLLANGSLLVAEVLKMTHSMLQVESDLLQPKQAEECQLRVGQVVGIVFRLPGPLTERDRLLDRLHHQAVEEDRLLLLNDDELRGRVEGIENQTVRFLGPLGPMDVEVARIRAVQFRRLPQAVPGPKRLRIWAGLKDGSLVLVDRLIVHQKKVELTLPGNLCFLTERENLVFLQPIGGQLVYLSDLEPTQYQFEPFFEQVWPYQRDRSVMGSWLRSAGRRYLKGLGVHSKASLKYQLAGRYRRLEAELALDDTSRTQGCVIYRVLADGKQVYQSDPIFSSQLPRLLRLDLSNVQVLELVVDYGPWGHVLDRANWLDARLIPASTPPNSSPNLPAQQN